MMQFVITFQEQLKTSYAAEASQFKSITVVDTPLQLKTARTNIDYIRITNEAFYNDISRIKRITGRAQG